MDTGFFLKESENRESYIVFRQNQKASGKEAMILLGNGVKAKCVINEDNKQIITEFLFDKNKFTKDAAKLWTKQNAANMEKGLQESAPKGSFLDTTLKVQDALNQSILFPKDEFGNSVAYVNHMFEDHVIVSHDGKDFRLDFKINADKVVEFEAPVEVRPEFVEESGGKKDQKYFDLIEKYGNSSLKEAKFDKKSRKLIAVLIEKGMNYDKKRFYPDSTIREAAELFAGIKMFIDHPTSKEEREKPERSVRDEVGIIEKSWYEDGKIMGQIHIHDEWLAQKLLDDVFRENAGLSINASGKRSYKTIEDMQVEVIEKIASPRSVDWVTEAGARGRVEQILESAPHKKGETDMKFEDLTLIEVKSNRPDLIESIRVQVKEEMKGENEKAIKEAVEKGIKEVSDKSEEEKRQSDYQTKLKGLFEASKLPKAAQEKLCESFKEKTFDSEADMEKKIKESITNELDYLSTVGGVKLTSDGKPVDNKTVRESAVKTLSDSIGLKEKKDEDED